MTSHKGQETVAASPRKRGGGKGSSPIFAMHARYEQTMAEYVTVEKAEREAREQNDEHQQVRYLRALKALTREGDALVQAILHQVPDVWAEAMILQFHIVNMFDMHTNCAGEPPEGEREALRTALDTVFDFMCCEIDQDHGEIGSSFRDGAVLAFYKRRHRTGLVED